MSGKNKLTVVIPSHSLIGIITYLPCPILEVSGWTIIGIKLKRGNINTPVRADLLYQLLVFVGGFASQGIIAVNGNRIYLVAMQQIE
jgi:hypothetical protein